MSEVLRMHDYVHDDGSMPTTLTRAPRRSELYSRLLDAADEFVNATRLEKKEAARRLMLVVDQVKRRERPGPHGPFSKRRGEL